MIIPNANEARGGHVAVVGHWDTNTQSRLQGRLALSASFLHIYIYLHALLNDEEDEDRN